MQCPANYVSFFELKIGFLDKPNGARAFADAVAALSEVYITDPNGQAARIPNPVLMRYDNSEPVSFAFLDTTSWSISLQKIRSAAGGLRPELYVGARLFWDGSPNISDSDDPDTFFVAGHDRFAEGLEPLEGCPVIVQSSASADHFEHYKAIANEITRTDYLDQASLAADFENHIKSVKSGPRLRNSELHSWLDAKTLRGDKVSNRIRESLFKDFKPKEWKQADRISRGE